MKLVTIIILFLIILGIGYFISKNYTTPATDLFKLDKPNDFDKNIVVNDTNFIYYNDFERGFSFKYPPIFYATKSENPHYVGLINYGNYGDVEIFGFQQFNESLQLKFTLDLPDQTATNADIQGKNGLFSQYSADNSVIRNFYFSCSNKNYIIASKIPDAYADDTDLYYYFIKNFNCNLT